ncbi:MAG: DUF1287 domain-containing protein [Candidatus Thiodiazotropha sp. (ex Codakia rugifera)]|nr:DUF1287 domain-containing protein [Candidatus Thiodiazotropha sp. (ex Codakia rugifera)]
MLKFTLSLILLATSTTCISTTFEEDLVAAALERTQHTVRYDGSYRSIAYPGGDVPDHIGVCTDVIIRTYRALGTDLQQLIHEDMVVNFKAYPSQRLWGLTSPDSNIDHRRVPNLQVFFERNAIQLPVSHDGGDYKPGDIVTWLLPGNLPHIGIVTDKLSTQTGLPLIVHNIGSGPVVEDMLFHYQITAHYHYLPQSSTTDVD